MLRAVAGVLRHVSQSRMYCDAVPTRLRDKTAVVVASTEGIGFQIAKRLALEGANVVVSSRSEAKVERAVSELQQLVPRDRVMGVPGHVACAEDRARLLDHAQNQFGGIDILVNNAAANPCPWGVLDTTESQWDKVFDVNLKAALLLLQGVVPIMELRGGGSVVMISSAVAYLPFYAPFMGAYCVSKMALIALTKASASQCAERNIRINCVCPGLIDTEFSRILTQNEKFMSMFSYITPIRRLGRPEEVAGLVAFLCSDDASYITGESIPVTGGHITRM